MAVRIQLRHDTAAEWTNVNPILAIGEVGVETDTTFHKIGDGVTAWTGLAYASGGGGTGVALSTVTGRAITFALIFGD